MRLTDWTESTMNENEHKLRLMVPGGYGTRGRPNTIVVDACRLIPKDRPIQKIMMIRLLTGASLRESRDFYEDFVKGR